MSNEKPFDTEEWLNSKKKGISGKVPRADFLAKMKELGEEIEKLKQEKNQLSEKLKTSSEQSEQKLKESEKKGQELAAKLENQAKEIENLQQNQEKHTEKDLKPENLPDNWEKQLSDKKDLEAKNKEMEGQLKAIYHTYPIIMEEEKPENIKKYIGELSKRIEELEKRPTIQELQQAIQQEAEKYKDYVKLSTQEQEAINNYSAIKTELEEAKKKLSETSGPAPNEAEQRKLRDYDALKTELEQLKVAQSKLKPKESEEIIKKVGELFTATITPLKLEIENSVKQIAELSKKHSPNNSSIKLPSDYENLKTSKEELLRILKFLNLKTKNS
ncbi:MAG: hypothetical protein I3273_04060 [Candidatus Moeniiplasma glomeromycotorum]|nr:hypothetical protein [Candidatus Moeniiplasma glomeromycotorum]